MPWLMLIRSPCAWFISGELGWILNSDDASRSHESRNSSVHQPLVGECVLGPCPWYVYIWHLIDKGDVEWLVWYLIGISGYLLTMELPDWLASKKKKVSISNMNRIVYFSRDGNGNTHHILLTCPNCPLCVVFRHGGGPGGPEGDFEGRRSPPWKRWRVAQLGRCSQSF